MKDGLWGPLAGRYAAAGPRRMLALDGGGMRGILALEMLAEMELQLAAITGTGASTRETPSPNSFKANSASRRRSIRTGSSASFSSSHAT